MPYEVRNVLKDEQAANEFVRLGGRLAPLLIIGGELVHGFQPDAIDEALERAAAHPHQQSNTP